MKNVAETLEQVWLSSSERKIWDFPLCRRPTSCTVTEIPDSEFLMFSGAKQVKLDLINQEIWRIKQKPKRAGEFIISANSI